MSGETWTEYAVRYSDGWVGQVMTPFWAKTYAMRYGGIVVGRTVTASPWLPVQEQA